MQDAPRDATRERAPLPPISNEKSSGCRWQCSTMRAREIPRSEVLTKRLSCCKARRRRLLEECDFAAFGGRTRSGRSWRRAVVAFVRSGIRACHGGAGLEGAANGMARTTLAERAVRG